MLTLEKMLETLGSVTRLHLMESLVERARTISELAKILGVSQQAVMKHLTILQKNGFVHQIKLNTKSKVKKVFALNKPLTCGYVFKKGTLCVYFGSNEYKVDGPDDLGALKRLSYNRKLLKMRIQVVNNRLRTLLEEDLKLQAKTNDSIKGFRLSPIEEIALRFVLSFNSKVNLEEGSKTFGCDLKKLVKNV